eukprot:1678235-Pyramimonas_sp.AAC.1
MIYCVNLRSVSDDIGCVDDTSTLEHALLPALTKPPAMFKDLLRLHYAHKRHEVEAQCHRWTADAA